jgi:hypothetical protein
LDQIQTESDWADLYSDGYFDYNSYLLYQDFAVSLSVTDTTDYLSAIGGNSLTEIDGIESFPAYSQVPFFAPVDTSAHGIIENNRPLWQIKTGYENRATVDNSYFTAQSISNDAEIFYKGRKRGSYYSSERRSLTLKGNSWNATIGNYNTSIGAGLSIGRYDYRPVSSADNESDFIFPDNSYYNGLKIEYLNRAAILYSAKKYEDLFKAFYAAAITENIRDLNIGISSTITHFSEGSHNRYLGSGSIFVISDNRKSKIEAAYAEAGMGFFAETNLSSFRLKGWYYADSYLNPQSSGYAYPDNKAFELFNNYRFRQPQAGESGLYIEHVTQLNNAIIKCAAESWIVSKTSGDISLSALCPIKDDFRLNIRLSGRGGAIRERYCYETELIYRHGAEVRALTNIWLSSGSVDHYRSFNQLYMMLPLNNTTLAGGRIKIRDNGRIEFFLEEKTIIDDNINLEATYRWRETDGPRLGPFYLVAECVI